MKAVLSFRDEAEKKVAFLFDLRDCCASTRSKPPATQWNPGTQALTVVGSKPAVATAIGLYRGMIPNVWPYVEL